ncbi:hypothetical protein [Methanocrinis sp.]|uniref:hypothetical protein n=1 Tax=Methanocrinis sp. TaxID=3101522 RepID=UPI003D126327
MAGVVSGVDESTDETNGTADAEVVADEAYTYIFIQEGTSGSFVEDGSGNYTLTINGVLPYTVYFADRPARDAGMVEMEQFIEGFSFDPNNPPNALLNIREGEEEIDMIVVELTWPQYNETTETLTYKARLTADYEFESEWPEDLLHRVDGEIPEEFGEVVIVIDDCPCMIDPGDCKSWWSNSCWTKPFCDPCGGCC